VDEWGRVYVADAGPAVIKLFEPDGRLVRLIGREGEGPGELRSGYLAVRGGLLAVHDPQLARTSVFDTAGGFRDSWHSVCCYYTDIAVDRAGRIVIPMALTEPGPRSRGRPYLRYSAAGAVHDTIWSPVRDAGKEWTVTLNIGGTRSSMGSNVPYQPGMIRGYHPDGGFVFGWNGGYELVRSATGVDTALLVGRAWRPDPVSDAQRDAAVEAQVRSWKDRVDEATIRAVARREDLPATLPAFSQIKVDEDGNTWVRRYPTSRSEPTRLDVFDSTGAYLGPVTVPLRLPGAPLLAWWREGLVAVIEGEDGRPAVVRFRVAKGG
jgi:hypothetical protein